MICFRGLSPTVAVRGLHPRLGSVGCTHGWGPWVAPTAGILPPLTRFDWIIHDRFRGLKPTAGILPPRRGSCGCYTFSVGCVHAFGVHSTHGWGTVIAMSVGYTHGWGTVIATRFMWVAPTAAVRGLHPRLESCHHDAVLIYISCQPWVACTPLAFTPPTAGIPPSLRDSCGLHPRLRSVGYHPRLGYRHRNAVHMVFHDFRGFRDAV